MGSGSVWYQIGKKACYIPKVSNVSLEKGKNVSSLACKCVFYRPENNAKGGTEFWKRGKWNWILKILKSKIEICQQKNFKE